MYYWVVILFSLVTIMTYKMSARQDDFENRMAPIMESAASGIVQQHKAALEYVEANPDTYTSTPLDGDLGGTMLSPYLPQGYKLGKYKTVIYCIDPNDGKNVEDCRHPNSMNFVATYGDLPAKWDDTSRNPYFLTMLGRYSARTNEVGIVEKTDMSTEGPVIGSDLVINSIAGHDIFVPEMYKCIDSELELTSLEGKLLYLTQITHAGDENRSIDDTSGTSCDYDLDNNDLDDPVSP